MSLFGNSILAGSAGQGGADLGDTIDQSLRFSASNLDFQYTPSTSGDRRTWTWATWVKRGLIDSTCGLLGVSAGASDAQQTEIRFESNGMLSLRGWTTLFRQTAMRFRDPNAWYHIVVVCDITNSTPNDRIRFFINGQKVTDWDSISNPGTSDIFAINYADNTRLGLRANGSDPLQGYLAETYFIDGTAISDTGGVIDEFGKYNDDGVWVPQNYTGSFGPNNGYHLKYDSSGFNGSGGIGADHSGSGNDFTASNFDTTAISSSNFDNDIDYEDTPTSNYATFNPIVNPGFGTNHDSGVTPPTFSEANLRATGALNNYPGVAMSTLTGDKVYFEFTSSGNDSHRPGLTLCNINYTTNSRSSSSLLEVFRTGGAIANGSTSLSNGTFPTWGADDIVRVTYDNTTHELSVAVNGGSFTTYDLDNISGYTVPDNYSFGLSLNDVGHYGYINYGQRPFVYSVPAGFSELQTNNLPEPTIKDGRDHFDVALYSGNTSTPPTVTGFNFQPDFIWIKIYSSGSNHSLYDSMRGATKVICSSSSSGEETDGTITPTSDGFTVGSDNTIIGSTNANGHNYVAWCWKAGDTASVTYTVKVVSDSGNKYRFDDFGASAVTLDLEEGGTYVFDQSDSSNSGHPLRFSTTSDGTHGGGSEYTTGVTTEGTPGSAGAKTTITVASGAPTLYYYCSAHSGMGGQADTNDTKGSSNFAGTIKSKVTANTDAGFSIITYTGNGGGNAATVGHGLTTAPEVLLAKRTDASQSWAVYHKDVGNDRRLSLHNADARTSPGANYWNNTSPTNSVFSIGSNINPNPAGDYVVYAWHSVEGFSKYGSYEGNNNSSGDGTYVYLGFKPSLIIFKNIDTTGSWVMYDTTRNTDNPVDTRLTANSVSSHGTSASMHVDFLSNGFKHRNNDQDLNTSHTFVYMAWASHPFGGENAPPATAR